MNNGLIGFVYLLVSLVVSVEPAQIDSVRVGTKTVSNPSVTVYYRVPAGGVFRVCGRTRRRIVRGEKEIHSSARRQGHKIGRSRLILKRPYGTPVLTQAHAGQYPLTDGMMGIKGGDSFLSPWTFTVATFVRDKKNRAKMIFNVSPCNGVWYNKHL